MALNLKFLEGIEKRIQAFRATTLKDIRDVSENCDYLAEKTPEFRLASTISGVGTPNENEHEGGSLSINVGVTVSTYNLTIDKSIDWRDRIIYISGVAYNKAGGEFLPGGSKDWLAGRHQGWQTKTALENTVEVRRAFPVYAGGSAIGGSPGENIPRFSLISTENIDSTPAGQTPSGTGQVIVPAHDKWSLANEMRASERVNARILYDYKHQKWDFTNYPYSVVAAAHELVSRPELCQGRAGTMFHAGSGATWPLWKWDTLVDFDDPIVSSSPFSALMYADIGDCATPTGIILVWVGQAAPDTGHLMMRMIFDIQSMKAKEDELTGDNVSYNGEIDTDFIGTIMCSPQVPSLV